MTNANDFEYIRPVVEKYGNLWFASDIEAFCRNVTKEQIADLQCAYEGIRALDHTESLSRWIDERARPKQDVSSRDRRFAQQAGQLLVLFEHLAESRIQPFASREVRYVEIRRVPNWSNLPAELSYLQEPAEEYRHIISEMDMIDVLGRITDEDMELLVRTAERIRLNDHATTISNWLRRFPMTEHEEAAVVYSLLGILDHAGLY